MRCVVDRAVLLVECGPRLEGLRVDGRPVRRRDHLERIGRQQWLPGCGCHLHLRRTNGKNVIPVATLASIANTRRLAHAAVRVLLCDRE